MSAVRGRFTSAGWSCHSAAGSNQRCIGADTKEQEWQTFGLCGVLNTEAQSPGDALHAAGHADRRRTSSVGLLHFVLHGSCGTHKSGGARLLFFRPVV